MLSTISKIAALLSAGLCGFLAFSASAQELKFPAENFAITPPAGWEKQSDNFGAFLSYVKPDKSAIVLVIVDSANKPGDVSDEAVIADFERGLEASGGGKRVWGRMVEVAGVQAYERLGELEVEDRPGTGMVRFFAVKDRSYGLQGVVFGENASEDPEILNFLESFRFLAPPTPVESASVAYKLGYQVGRYIKMGFVLGAAVGVVFLVIWLFKKSFPKRRRRGRSI